MEEQKALNDYLSSLDAKELVKTLEREKKGKRARAAKKGWTSSLRKGISKVIIPESQDDIVESTSPKAPGRSESKELVTQIELPNSTAIVKFLLYNIDICTSLLDCAIEVGSYREVCSAILTLFRVNRVEHNLIMFCLKRELEANRNYSFPEASKTTLFRDNGSGTTLLSAYCKLKGLSVLKDILSSFLSTVLDCPLAIETDPNRCNEEAAAKNVIILSKLVDNLLEKLYTYHDKFPSYDIDERFSEFTQNGDSEISGIGDEDYRGILLFEAFMVPFNPLIQKHIPKMASFLEKLANPPDNGSYFIPKADVVSSQPEEVIETTKEVRTIVEKIIEYGAKVKKSLVGESSEQFSNFYNIVLKEVDRIESIGWKPLEQKLRKSNSIGDAEFANISRDAFLLAREALCQCEDELKEVRHKLEEERILRLSMQHIIHNMAESLYFQFDESIQHHVRLITDRRESVSDLGDEFCDLLSRKSGKSPGTPRPRETQAILNENFAMMGNSNISKPVETSRNGLHKRPPVVRRGCRGLRTPNRGLRVRGSQRGNRGSRQSLPPSNTSQNPRIPSLPQRKLPDLLMFQNKV